MLYNSEYIMGNVDFNSTMWSSKYMDAFADSANDLGCWAERMMKTVMKIVILH